jgi:hypothetical protein
MLYSPRDAGDLNFGGTAMSVPDLMRLANVPLTIVHAFTAGSQPSRWEMSDT